jgi:hypothetical protein
MLAHQCDDSAQEFGTLGFGFLVSQVVSPAARL